MMYNFNKMQFTDDDIQYYIDCSVNKLYATLCVFEDCEKRSNFETYHIYLKRLITEFTGIYDIFDISVFLSVVGILNGMILEEDPKHKDVKSLIFHCISLLKKR